MGLGDVGGVEQFSEPDDGWSGEAATFEAGGDGVEVIARGPGFKSAFGAPVDHDIAVKGDDVGIPGRVVQAVYVLGNDGEIGYDPSEVGEGEVPGVRLDGGESFSS